jgi:hypothetical protein
VEAFAKDFGQGETEPPIGWDERAGSHRKSRKMRFDHGSARMGTDGSAALTTGKKQTKRIILFESEPEAHASESMTLCVYP